MRTLFTSSKCPITQALIVLILLFACAPMGQASTPVYGVMPVNAYEAKEEFRHWEDRIKQALEDEELPVYWAKRALHYVRNGDDNAIDRARILLNKVVDQPDPSAAALYEIGIACLWKPLKNWCSQNLVIEKLKESDPDNLAVYFADLPDLAFDVDMERIRELDTDENRERLRLASSAACVDEYYSRDAASWAKYAREASLRTPPPKQAVATLIDYYRKGISEQQLHGFHRPIEGVIWNYVHVGRGNSPLKGLPHLCGLMALLSDEEGITHCEMISDLLLLEGTESNHAYIGHRINSAMVAAVDPDSPELKHLRALWMTESREEKEQRLACERPVWSMNGIMPNGGLNDLNLYYQDLQDSSYIIANRNGIARELVAAGLPANDCRDRESSITIMRTYWPDYQPPPINENP